MPVPLNSNARNSPLISEGVEQGIKEICRLLHAAAEQGDAGAQCNLGLRYAKGEGVEQDEKVACHWFLAAAQQGHAGAQCWLGEMYKKSDGIPHDVDQSCRLYRAAAEQGKDHLRLRLPEILQGVPISPLGDYTGQLAAHAQIDRLDAVEQDELLINLTTETCMTQVSSQPTLLQEQIQSGVDD